MKKIKGNMKKGGFVLALLMTLLLSFALSLEHAQAVNPHFVCGQVNNAPDGTDSGWREVRLYYPADPANYGTNQVSPQDSRYCIDSTDIRNHVWRAGDILNVEIIDSGDGYYAGPASITTTAGNPDIAPEMQLLHPINIYSPLNTTYFTRDIPLNLSTKAEYSSAISYSLDGTADVLACNNCNSFSTTFSALAEGSHSIAVSATAINGSIARKTVYFSIVLERPAGRSVPGKGDEIHYEKFGTLLPGKGATVKTVEKAEGGGVTEVKISVNNEFSDVSVSVVKFQGAPADVATPPQKVYQYYEVTLSGLVGEGIEKALTRFKIEQKWLERNRFDKDNVAVLRYNPSLGEWQEIPAVKTNENEEFAFYEVQTEGFSLFAIIADKLPKDVAVSEEGGYTRLRTSALFVTLMITIILVVYVLLLVRRRKSLNTRVSRIKGKRGGFAQ